MKHLKASHILFLQMCLAFGALAQPVKKRIPEFEKFPEKVNPVLIGKRLSEHFMEKPHSTFGAFKATPATEITYPDACAWYGSLSFAKLTGDKDLTQRLV